MIQLRNCEKLHAAYLLPGQSNMKPSGLVLAETATDWVTWLVHWDGDTIQDERGQIHEVWEAESGHYYQKSMPILVGNPKDQAEFDFGLRLKYMLTYQTKRGVE